MFPELYLTFTDPERRRLIQALHATGSDDGVPVSDLVAAQSNEPEAVPSEVTSVHLPYLERAGFVEWDVDRDRVWRGPRFTELEPFLSVAEQFEGQSAIGWPS